MTGSETLLPAWLVLPSAALAMAVILANAAAAYASPIVSELRRRIRVANSVLLLTLVVLLAYALGVLPVLERPTSSFAETRIFLLTWTAIMGLLLLVVALATADAAVMARAAIDLRRRQRQRLAIRLAADPADRRS
jgi:FtsH-binding integral membrane protein